MREDPGKSGIWQDLPVSIHDGVSIASFFNWINEDNVFLAL